MNLVISGKDLFPLVLFEPIHLHIISHRRRQFFRNHNRRFQNGFRNASPLLLDRNPLNSFRLIYVSLPCISILDSSFSGILVCNLCILYVTYAGIRTFTPLIFHISVFIGSVLQHILFCDGCTLSLFRIHLFLTVRCLLLCFFTYPFNQISTGQYDLQTHLFQRLRLTFFPQTAPFLQCDSIHFFPICTIIKSYRKSAVY